MRGALVFAVLAALCTACGGAPASRSATQSLAGVPACGDGDIAPPNDPNNPFKARQCKIEQGRQRMLVHFVAAPADNADRGTIIVDVLGADGAIRQSITETNIDEYYDPVAVDFDRDGHLDLEILHEGGVANEDMALWRFNPGVNQFQRIGEVSGFGVQRTADGYLSVANRSGAGEYGVEFYRLDGSSLTLLLSLSLEGDDADHVTCTIAERGPAFASLNMNDAALRTKFCADPSTRLFDQ
ncbi:MAG: hypothetical protein WAU68_15940 [Vitreimonas sp.]